MGLSSFNRVNSADVSGENTYNKAISGVLGCLFFDITQKNFQSNLVIVVVLILKSNGLYYLLTCIPLSSILFCRPSLYKNFSIKTNIVVFVDIKNFL